MRRAFGVYGVHFVSQFHVGFARVGACTHFRCATPHTLHHISRYAPGCARTILSRFIIFEYTYMYVYP